MIYRRPYIRSDVVTFESKHFYILQEVVGVGEYDVLFASARYQSML